MNEECIGKKELVRGAYYTGHCRNAGIARWDGFCFWYWRTKFGTTFLERICHPEDDTVFDVFYPRAPLEEFRRIPIPSEGEESA